MKRIRLSAANVGKAEMQALNQLLCPDTHLGMGDEVIAFEYELANYLAVDPHCVIAVNSGTAALHLACVASCSAGSEIIVPSLNYVAGIQAIYAAQCKANFCDVKINTANLDLEHAKAILNEKTKAIMPMHYASNPCDLDDINEFAVKNNLHVIEDAAHAFGCTYKGRKIGSFGDIICFSFDGIKNITCGEGGAIVAFNKDIARTCRSARSLSIIKQDHDFDVKCQGWRYHMSNICAKIGRVQLSRLHSEFAKIRKDLVKIYYTELQELEKKGKISFLYRESSSEIIPHIFVIRVLNGKRDSLKSALKLANIETAIHYKPNHLLTYFKSPVQLAVTQQLYSELLSLPLHTELKMEQVEYICHHIKQHFI